ncbi:DUF4062 domain-containing protein [Streptomyces sp. NBC_01373]|uniref:DUF4062 domain-containing protein n=1 Tax=Streptomyces sp. NBC_01373 TaxID=2903843 RepID=UPI00225AAB90|nr:DUF4062 domain-containing protein [Streptomyces sp. NBC_01373]MCX4699053.1 DUF4062 domain-containing protein [Streptomyces sp. NBC_01373]
MVAADKRYQVFISSTYLDLKEERHAVMSALLNLDAIPAGMELFPATDATAWNLIKQVIDDCDYYLVVIGGKYGTIDPDSDLSYTEKEYDYAKAAGKPVMAFLHGNVAAISGSKLELDSGVAEKLNIFREKIKKSCHVKYWESADQLAGHVALSLPAQIKLHPAVGWVRANQVTTAESLQDIERLRKRIAELETQLAEAAHTPPPGTSHLAGGDDPVNVAIDVTFRYRLKGQSNLARSKLTAQRVFAWDELFSMTAPLLLGECEQERLREVVNDWFTDHLWSTDIFANEVMDLITDAELTLEDVDIYDHILVITPDDFDGMLIQFIALGLVEKGTRKRPVADPGTYWKLTPYGQTRMVQLRAKTKPD